MSAERIVLAVAMLMIGLLGHFLRDLHTRFNRHEVQDREAHAQLTALKAEHVLLTDWLRRIESKLDLVVRDLRDALPGGGRG